MAGRGPHDLSIGDAARRSGVKIETIRFYERIGLLAPPPRSAGGHRVFGGAEVERLGRAHLDATRDRIADLKRMEGVLADMVARCAGGTVPDCPILEALFENRA